MNSTKRLVLCVLSTSYVISVLQILPVVVAAFVVAVTVLYFLLRGSAGEKKKKLPVTLQDPTVKYPLQLIEKQVGADIHAHTHS